MGSSHSSNIQKYNNRNIKKDIEELFKKSYDNTTQRHFTPINHNQLTTSSINVDTIIEQLSMKGGSNFTLNPNNIPNRIRFKSETNKLEEDKHFFDDIFNKQIGGNSSGLNITFSIDGCETGDLKNMENNLKNVDREIDKIYDLINNSLIKGKSINARVKLERENEKYVEILNKYMEEFFKHIDCVKNVLSEIKEKQQEEINRKIEALHNHNQNLKEYQKKSEGDKTKDAKILIETLSSKNIDRKRDLFRSKKKLMDILFDELNIISYEIRKRRKYIDQIKLNRRFYKDINTKLEEEEKNLSNKNTYNEKQTEWEKLKREILIEKIGIDILDNYNDVVYLYYNLDNGLNKEGKKHDEIMTDENNKYMMELKKIKKIKDSGETATIEILEVYEKLRIIEAVMVENIRQIKALEGINKKMYEDSEIYETELVKTMRYELSLLLEEKELNEKELEIRSLEEKRYNKLIRDTQNPEDKEKYNKELEKIKEIKLNSIERIEKAMKNIENIEEREKEKVEEFRKEEQEKHKEIEDKIRKIESENSRLEEKKIEKYDEIVNLVDNSGIKITNMEREKEDRIYDILHKYETDKSPLEPAIIGE